MTKWPAQKQTHRTAQNTPNNQTLQTFRTNCCLCFLIFPFLYYTSLNDFSKKCWVTTLVRLINVFHWGVKPLFCYSKPLTYSTFIGDENENKLIYTIYPGNLIVRHIYGIYVYLSFWQLLSNLFDTIAVFILY